MTAATTEIPQRIGPYEILREIGRGGMGIVYLAREPDEGTLIALKVLPGEWTRDATRLKRFQREAATVMKVPHPNIVPIYSVGCAAGVWFIAMKFIDGTSLDEMIWNHANGLPLIPERDLTDIASRDGAERPSDGSERAWDEIEGGAAHTAGLPEETPEPEAQESDPDADPAGDPDWVYRSVHVVEKVARALAHVHEQGIVHRDIKPGNILIDRAGEAWLADFGLGRDVDTAMSQVEGILGTVQYLAPEQVKNGQTGSDHRSDIYALGVTLYESVTLKRPFDGSDVTSTLYSVARESPPPPRKLNPELSEELERVIQKAMAKHPDARYQSATAFAEDLRRVRMSEPVEAARPQLFANLRALGGENPGRVAVLAFLVFLLLALTGYCVRNELRESRRLAECRAEADEAFDRGRYDEAAEGYRFFLRLGGDDADVRHRLGLCGTWVDRPSPK